MHWIIDLVLLLIILLCAWRGFRNGLIAGILAYTAGAGAALLGTPAAFAILFGAVTIAKRKK